MEDNLPLSINSTDFNLVVNTTESVESEIKSTASRIVYMDVVFDLNDSIAVSTSHVRGLGRQFARSVSSKFELQNKIAFYQMPLNMLQRYEQYLLKDLLVFMLPNKFKIDELTRLNILRKFVIRSYQGLSHAHGKPIHGQRTWSNGNTAFKQNKVAREFIAERRRLKQIFEDSLNHREQSKVKRKKKRRKIVIRSKEDHRNANRPTKLEKKFKSGRRALRKKKKKFDVWC